MVILLIILKYLGATTCQMEFEMISNNHSQSKGISQ
ncbi:hypothetical protein PHIM7_312 [Sinorhizobium phage phiM7]|uniref:Uncharacterized protein n=1 Tax=Sinorhizobium phage phiM7 TaxID=1647403 RepID=A0A0F6SIQ4_9CAUD|nr:hypothetical protein FDH46_gp166 [Sinorhizobium phage phiM7]AKF12858.1 hypothetical protein PHIM7_312 [Sinorhizobium phage phiM7]AKF13217.1 hypothetical protein PHIM19_312 [Sinorhizobium phage phiM19]